MELKDAIERRTSIRSFRDDAIPLEDLKEMIRRAGLAPSVNNFQPWSFILITNKDLLKKMAAIISEKYNQFPFKKTEASKNIIRQVEWYSTFFTGAPAVVALVLEKYESILERGTQMTHDEINLMRNYPDIQSAGACIQNLLLSAVDMGYGGCWLSGPMIARSEMEEILGIKEPSRLLNFVALGKPSKDFQPKDKEDLSKKIKLFQ